MGTQQVELRDPAARQRLRLLALDRRRIGGDCVGYWRAFMPAETPLHDEQRAKDLCVAIATNGASN
jgi:hypothetical protein